MKENEMEQLMEKICREQLEPPEHLTAYTKQKLKRSRFLNLGILISLFLNAVLTVFTTALVFAPGLDWLDKISWYIISTAFFNGLIILILLNKEKVTAFFSELTYAVNYEQ
jgi:hypothetical protein